VRTLLQVGEFAFVLLSLASNLGLINSRLSMLLLGVTAISLLTTPIVFALAHSVLPRETAVVLPMAKTSSARKGSPSSNVSPSNGGKDKSVWHHAPRWHGQGASQRGSGASVLRISRPSGAAECARHSHEATDPPWMCVRSEAEGGGFAKGPPAVSSSLQ
jgi:hypothetical protein